jgi:hypothetical protein
MGAPPTIEARPGARFTCHGDGLCCMDIHQLGPVTAREQPAVEAAEHGAVVRVGRLRLLRLSDTQRPGGCTFLDAEARCRIYALDGGRTKPRACHRFPYLLARTPEGLRVGTDHRCPCRTLGERAPIEPACAADALRDAAGRWSVDRRVEGRIPIGPRRHVGWARYRALEAALLTRLAQVGAPGGPPDVAAALEVEPFPALPGRSWETVGIALAHETRTSRWGEAFRLFGRTLAWLHAPEGERPPRLSFPPRLWREAFDRAERRTRFEGDPAELERAYADFAADVLWALEWTFFHDLARLRLELASRVAVGRAFARALTAQGVRADRAVAESITMIEVVGVSPAWLEVVVTLPR